jgi:hypothetical protein
VINIRVARHRGMRLMQVMPAVLLFALPRRLVAQKPSVAPKAAAVAATPTSRHAKAILVSADSAYQVVDWILIRAMLAGGNQATTSYTRVRNDAFLAFRESALASALDSLRKKP